MKFYLIALILSSCTPAWKTTCNEYGCDYSAWHYCYHHCEVYDSNGGCSEYELCEEKGTTCPTFRGVSKANLDKEHNPWRD